MTEQPPAADGERLEVLVATVVAAHGDRLDETQRETLRRHVERLRQAAQTLDAYGLENADEPDASFQAIDRVDAL